MYALSRESGWLCNTMCVPQARSEGYSEEYIQSLTEMLRRGDDGVTWRVMFDNLGADASPGAQRTQTIANFCVGK